MKAAVLYSGGKDSSFMAVMLKRLGLDVELCTANFGVYDSYIPASKSAKSLGFNHRVLDMDTDILDKTCDMILEDGFPNDGIKYIHENVVEMVAEKYDSLYLGFVKVLQADAYSMNYISFEELACLKESLQLYTDIGAEYYVDVVSLSLATSYANNEKYKVLTAEEKSALRKATKEPNLVLIEAKKGAKAGLKIMSPLILNNEDGTEIVATVKVCNINYLKNPSFEDADVSMWKVNYLQGSGYTDIQNKAYSKVINIYIQTISYISDAYGNGWLWYK